MLSIRPHPHPAPRGDVRHRIAGVEFRHRGSLWRSVVAATAASSSEPAARRPLRDGVVLGATVAAVTWLWLALVDLAFATPFETFVTLGGVLAFTAGHVLLCIAYGVALAAITHAALRQAGFILAVVFGALLLEIAFAMMAVLLSTTALGQLAWIRIFAGSILGTGVAFAMLARWYPVAELLRRAQHDD